MATSTSGPSTFQRLAAEVVGTFILVFGVIGAAIIASGFNAETNGVGFLGVAFALGFSVLIAAYMVGGISGGHFNPAVSIGLALAKRFAWKDVPSYALAQIVGGLLATTALYAIAAGGPDGFLQNAQASGFGSTGYDALSPAGFNASAGIIAEVIATGLLVWVILGATSDRVPAGFAPIAIGFTLVVLNIVVVPITGGSFNPARSIATAVYGGDLAISQLWLSVLGPIVGGALGALSYNALFGTKKK